jgi:hypothetical protein
VFTVRKTPIAAFSWLMRLLKSRAESLLGDRLLRGLVLQNHGFQAFTHNVTLEKPLD